jgi:hypothetical protein
MEIHCFFGLTGYYRMFIEGFSTIMTLMTWLTRKEVKWDLSKDCEKSFQELKKRLTIAAMSTIPLGSKGFVVYSDASKKGVGCVLMQYEKVIAYASIQLKPHKVNYLVRDLEVVVVVFALRVWRHYLCWTWIQIFIDHKSLRCLMS